MESAVNINWREHSPQKTINLPYEGSIVPPKTIVLLWFGLICPFAFGQRSQGEIELRTHKITVDNLERTYRLAVPPSSTHPMPVVLVLHGGGFGERGALHVIDYTKFTNVAMRERFIVGYPMGVDGNWNDGRGAESIRAQREGIDDVKFLRSVVDDIASKYPVDRTRVFCTGISNGGFMSNRMAADASDLVAAVAPVIGGMSPSLAKRFSPKHPVSAYIIQGQSDPMIPFNGGSVGRRRKETRGETVSTKEIVALYIKHNRIAGRPRVVTVPNVSTNNDTTTRRWTYPLGRGRAKLQVDTIENGGHTWPGTKPYMSERLIGKTSQDYNATEAIWEFFESCSLARAE